MLPPSALAEQVRHALTEAGFHLIAGQGPGLQVSETPGGALIRWVASDEFQALTGEQSGRAQGDGMQAMVQGRGIRTSHATRPRDHSGRGR
ncbi:hypothetical protein [Streptomyces sp. NPDC048256]|uniref:hypothetical protein n=1 Tax=unclassified Streptomyces TaxID=2593676 RepID=UPI0033DEDEF2